MAAVETPMLKSAAGVAGLAPPPPQAARAVNIIDDRRMKPRKIK
jgi:hypothetical protein